MRRLMVGRSRWWPSPIPSSRQHLKRSKLLRELGLRVIVLTGDNERTARNVTKRDWGSTNSKLASNPKANSNGCDPFVVRAALSR